MKNIILVSYSFIAALIGAGFASGQEILCYFAAFGRMGVVGIALTSFLIFIFIYSVLRVSSAYGLYSIDSFFDISPVPFIKRLIRIMLAVFSFSVYAAMLSAFGEIMSGFGIPPHAGALTAVALCAILLCLGNNAVFDINGLIGMILTAAIMTCSVYMIRYREYHTFSQLTPVTLNAGIYSGFNLLPALPILTVMSRRISGRSEAAAAAFISATAAGVMLIMIYFLIATYAGKIHLGELPMLTLAARQSRIFAGVYRAILLTASATTLLSSGGSVLEAVPGGGTPLSVILLSVSGFFLSFIGFSTLVSSAYRICGMAGIIVVIYIIYLCVKTKNNRVNSRIS